ncbi:MAG: methylmalonyl-CoA mutase family protein [Planctomycetota bacterium]
MLYTRRNLESLPHLQAGLSPHLKPRPGWAIRERVTAADPARAGRAVALALRDGAQEIELIPDEGVRRGLPPRPEADENALGCGGIALYTGAQLAQTLEHADLSRVAVSLDAGPATLATFAHLLRLADARGLPHDALRGELGFDATADPQPDAAWSEAVALLEHCRSHAPGMRPLRIDATRFHDAGGSVIEELAGLACATIETFRRLDAAGQRPTDVARGLTLRVSVSHEFLREIAQLRAARLLWLKIAAAFGVADDAREVPLVALTSARMVAQHHDLRTNLLRSATAAVAAVCGGCDALVTQPYVLDPQRQDQAARSLARHQQLLLRDESFLDRVADPLGGAFAVEALTDAVGAEAWSLVQEIEGAGGLGEGAGRQLLQSRIEERRETCRQRVRRRERALIGINRYADPGLDEYGHLGWTSLNWEDLETAVHLSIEVAAPDDATRDRACAELAAGTERVECAIAAARTGIDVAAMVRASRGATFPAARDLPRGDGFEFEATRPRGWLLAGRWHLGHVLLADCGPSRGALDGAADVLAAGGYRARSIGVHQQPADLKPKLDPHHYRAVILGGDPDAIADRAPVWAKALAPFAGIRLYAALPPTPDLETVVDGFVWDGMDAVAFLHSLYPERHVDA